MAIVEVKPGMTREVLVFGEKLMTVRFTFKAGTALHTHDHPHEQTSYVVSGRLQFSFDNREVVLTAGEALHFPSDMPHGGVALEDTVVLDSFSPMRKDFLD